MTVDWLETTDQGLHTGVIFLDLRKAFDVVNHDLLVAKLQLYTPNANIADLSAGPGLGARKRV